MRKIYSIFMLAVMALVMSFTAKAASLIINVDDPNRVSVQINYEEQTLVAGDNTFELTVGNYVSVYIQAKEGALLKSVVDENGIPQSIYSGMVSTYAYPEDENYTKTFTVTSVALAEARTASCTINVDKAENIGGLEMNSTYERVNLVDGANTVSFIPDMESPFSLSCPYGQTFYKVTVDGVEVTEDWGTWYLYVNDGSVVDILTEFPDVEVAVNVAFSTEEAKGALKGMMVGEEVVTPDADGNVNVKLGETVTLVFDKTYYALSSFTINGSEPTDYSIYDDSYSFVVKEATNIAIDAHKYETLNTIITVDNPQCVVVTDYNGDVINLVAGENAIEISENAASIKVTKAAGCQITSILVNGVEASDYGYDSPYGTTISIPSDGTTIVITANEIVYDNKAYIYIDEECYSYSYIQNANTRDQIYLTKGEAKVGFNNGNELHRLNVMTTNYNAPAAIYLNCLFLSNYANTEVTLADGDYIKVFMTERPEESVVTFEKIAFTGDNVTVTVDDKVVTNWEAGFTVLKGTEISVTGAQVIVNDTVVNGDGTYTFTADDAETKVVLCDNAVGIEELGADTGAVEYYNLQGVKVANPENGIFIKKQGSKATKVIL